jgi:hypothetical protein
LIVTTERVPAGIVGFLNTYVESHEMLMLLLLVHRSPGNTVSVAVASRIADLPIAEVRTLARELADRQLVRVSGYPELIELTVPSIHDRLALADLATWYEHNRTIVLEVLVAIARTRELNRC